jgi:penicillin-binding protein 1A
VTTPLVDTVSLPVGADEVKLIDMVAANGTLANGGIRVKPYAAIEVRNSSGKLIYSHARDSGTPARVLPADKVAEMNNIMTHVVTEGTGRAAQIPGLVICGKTGTTNNSTNAWFNAFTGNLVGSVWFGNDDNSSMENLTGGVLPAMTWREIMAFAHQGLEAKPPFGVAAPPPTPSETTAKAAAKAAQPPIESSPPRIGFSPRATRAILELSNLAREALKGRRTSTEPQAAPAEAGQSGVAQAARSAGSF